MQHIQNGQPAPPEMLRYKYRRLFHLSAHQMEQEPIDDLNVMLFINSELKKQEAREIKNGSS